MTLNLKINQKFSRLSRLLLLATTSAGTAHAAVITIQPQNESESKDTKIYQSVATSSFSSNLNVVSPDITDFRGLVQFDLGALVGLGVDDIGSASVRLYVSGMNLNAQSTAASATVTLSPILNPWKETAADAGSAPLATWDDLFGSNPSITSGSAAASQTVTGVGFVDWDITPLLKAWVGATTANNGLLIQAPGPLGDVGIADVDSAGAGFGPALIVTTVPEPMLLPTLAMAGLLGLARRRRAEY